MWVVAAFLVAGLVAPTPTPAQGPIKIGVVQGLTGPFEVYAKALQEFFRGHEMTVGEWELAGREKGGSWM